jgi:hypothetical protein
MRLTYSIMNWACAVALLTGIGLTSAHGAAAILGYFCWPTGGQTCQDLASLQCGNVNNGGAGANCVYCDANVGLFQHTCVAYNQPRSVCPITGNIMNCGNKFSGKCKQVNNVWQCANQQPVQPGCTKVYEC